MIPKGGVSQDSWASQCNHAVCQNQCNNQYRLWLLLCCGLCGRVVDSSARRCTVLMTLQLLPCTLANVRDWCTCCCADAERNMLVKLKTECGYQFTSKLESMFTDIKTSRDMMADFKARLTEKGIELPLDLSVQVSRAGLTQGSGTLGGNTAPGVVVHSSLRHPAVNTRGVRVLMRVKLPSCHMAAATRGWVTQ